MHFSVPLSNNFFYNHFFGGPKLFTLSNLGVLKKLWYKKAFQLTRYIYWNAQKNLTTLFLFAGFFFFLFSWLYMYKYLTLLISKRYSDSQVCSVFSMALKVFHIVCLSIKETRQDKIVLIKMRVNWSQRGVVD